jgi:hypothetical protein
MKWERQGNVLRKYKTGFEVFGLVGRARNNIRFMLNS